MGGSCEVCSVTFSKASSKVQVQVLHYVLTCTAGDTLAPALGLISAWVLPYPATSSPPLVRAALSETANGSDGAAVWCSNRRLTV